MTRKTRRREKGTFARLINYQADYQEGSNVVWRPLLSGLVVPAYQLQNEVSGPAH